MITGAFIADRWLGRYRTILGISLFYVIGHLLLAITAIPGLTSRENSWYGPLIGLFIVAFGTGKTTMKQNHFDQQDMS